MATPAQVDVRVGPGVGKGERFADVLDDDGERLFAGAVAGDQADLEALLDRAARHGTPRLVIDQPGSIARLALAVAARRGMRVAYVPGLVMRRAADLCPGEAKTGRRDACVLADTGRVVAELAAGLHRVCARRDAVAAEIEETFLAHPFGELLASIPGIGPRTGARSLAEAGDGSAFATGSKLAAYAGPAPVTRQSGLPKAA